MWNDPAEELDLKAECTEIFMSAFKCPTLITANFIPQSSPNLLVNAKYTQRDFEFLNTTSFQQSIFVSKDLQSITTVPPVYINEILSAVSPNGVFKAVLLEGVKSANQTEKPFKLEIWERNILIKNYDLTALKIHGNVYGDSTFGCLKWSATNDKVVYIAEKYVTQSEPFYKRKLAEDTKKLESTSKGDKYVKIDDWGETLESTHNTVVVMWHADKKLPFVLDSIPQGISPSKIIWAPDNEGIVGVGYKNRIPRYGVVYCTNRHSCLFYAKPPNVYVCLTGDVLAVNSPRFNPAGNLLVWLERSVGGPHHAAHRLMKLHWDYPTIIEKMKVEDQKSVVIDTVDTCTKTDNDKSFYGIYCLELPNRCWISNNCLLFSTPKECFIATYVVDVESKIIYEILTAGNSYTVLDVYENFVLCGGSSLKNPTIIFIAKIDGLSENLLFVPLTSRYDLAQKYEITVDRIRHRNLTVDPADYWSLLLRPVEHESQKKSYPLIVALHGGPHSVISDVFSSTFYYFAQLGFAVFIINYHGSIGMGERSLKSLLGNIGSLDTGDIHRAVQELLNNNPSLDKKNIMLFGGSHGGYLVTMLNGLYPGFYRGVVARNPVTNLPLALWTSDIPDWAAVESGVISPVDPYVNVLTACTKNEFVNKMMSMSPTNFVTEKLSPTLLLIGKNDLRVPSAQSIVYYNMLREKNVPTKLLCYDDNHSLSTLPAEMDGIINSALWFISNRYCENAENAVDDAITSSTD